MLETVMTINIAEFEHFYSVEENNYLTRWQNQQITKSVANIKEKSLKERIMVRKQARERYLTLVVSEVFYFQVLQQGPREVAES